MIAEYTNFVMGVTYRDADWTWVTYHALKAAISRSCVQSPTS
jgi:hypothetical protein